MPLERDLNTLLNQYKSPYSEQYVSALNKCKFFGPLTIDMQTISFSMKHFSFVIFLCKELLRDLTKCFRPFKAFRNHEIFVKSILRMFPVLVRTQEILKLQSVPKNMRIVWVTAAEQP